MGEWPCGKFFLTMARSRPCSKSRAITSWCTICVPVGRKAWLIAKRTFRVSDPRSNRANTSGGCRRLFEGRFLERKRGFAEPAVVLLRKDSRFQGAFPIAMAQGLGREAPFCFRKNAPGNRNME